MDAVGELKQALERLLRGMFPGVMGYRGPIRARVVAVHEGRGRMSLLEPRYSVDVQPLTPDLDDDLDQPVIPDVELPIPWAGPGRGVWCLPAVGAIVRVAFYGGDPNAPYVEAPLGYGYDAEGEPQGRFAVRAGDTHIVIEPNGEVEIRGGQVRVQGAHVLVEGTTEVRGNVSVQGSMHASGPVSSGAGVSAPSVAAEVLSVGGKAVPGSAKSGTILITPQSTVSIQVQNGMVMDWL